MPRLARCLIASLLSLGLLLVLSCGGGSPPSRPPPSRELPPGAPPVPTPSDPWFGTAGNVLISDRNHSVDSTLDFLWVGFYSSANWQNFLTLHNQPPNGFYIGGRVVVDSKSPLGFYFDPDTVVSAEVVPEGEVTYLDTIKQNPSYYADVGWSWYVTAITESVR